MSGIGVKRLKVGATYITAAALLATAAASTPAFAAARCRPYEPRLHESRSGLHDEAADQDLIVVTDAATKRRPLTIEYEHGPGIDLSADSDPIIPEAAFFNLQVRSKKRPPRLNVRTEWPSPSPQDVELFVYASSGEEIAASTSFNPLPEIYNDDDGNGWEQILRLPARHCEGFTVESQGGITVSVQATLKVWLD